MTKEKSLELLDGLTYYDTIPNDDKSQIKELMEDIKNTPKFVFCKDCEYSVSNNELCAHKRNMYDGTYVDIYHPDHFTCLYAERREDLSFKETSDENIFISSSDHYYFSDETGALQGPYDTLEFVKKVLKEYIYELENG